MTVRVRSAALVATAARVSVLADQLREDAALLAGALAGTGPPRVREPGDVLVVGSWLRLEGEAIGLVGPHGVWGEALALESGNRRDEDPERLAAIERELEKLA